MDERAEVLSVRARKLVWGGIAWFFTAGALLRASYGDVAFPAVLGVFALGAFTLKWMTGKWWAEL